MLTTGSSPNTKIINRKYGKSCQVNTSTQIEWFHHKKPNQLSYAHFAFEIDYFDILST